MKGFRKKIAWLLAFCLALPMMLSDNSLSARAAETSLSFTVSISLAGGTEAESYGVDYEIVDAGGNSAAQVSGNTGSYRGRVDQNDSTASTGSLAVDDTYRVKFTVQDAGKGVRLDGNNWNSDLTYSVSEANGRTFAFELYDAPSSAATLSVRYDGSWSSETGQVYFKSADDDQWHPVGENADNLSATAVKVVPADSNYNLSSNTALRVDGIDIITNGETDANTSADQVTNSLISDNGYTLRNGVSYAFENVAFESANSGSGAATLSVGYENGWSLAVGEIQWKNGSDDEWHTVQSDENNISATAVRVVPTEGHSLAGYTGLRVDGNNIIADEGVAGALTSADGYQLTSGKSYLFEHVDFKQAGGGDVPDPGSDFSGTAYFIWQGADDALCAHRITGLEGSIILDENGDKAGYKIIYIPVTDVKDDQTGEQLVISNVVDNSNYYWIWEETYAVIRERAYTTWAQIEAAVSALDYDDMRDMIIDPTGAVNGNSTICTNGDRQFRATIYDASTFMGVAFGDNENDYYYFPDFWDSVFFSNVVDISGTSAANPAVYESVLLEEKILFRVADGSVAGITQVTALDVPEGAVNIEYNNGAYEITYGSNYFDDVVFQITTAGGTYYLQIIREALQVDVKGGPDAVEPFDAFAKLYFDSEYSYQDYEVYATLCFTDGSTEVQKLDVSEIETLPNGDPAPTGTYEWNGGKNLKWAQYQLPTDSGADKIAINVIRSDALSGANYTGSYLGSDQGIYYDVNAYSVQY